MHFYGKSCIHQYFIPSLSLCCFIYLFLYINIINFLNKKINSYVKSQYFLFHMYKNILKLRGMFISAYGYHFLYIFSQYYVRIKFSYKISCNLRLQPYSISFSWRRILINPSLNNIFLFYSPCLKIF